MRFRIPTSTHRVWRSGTDSVAFGVRPVPHGVSIPTGSRDRMKPCGVTLQRHNILDPCIRRLRPRPRKGEAASRFPLPVGAGNADLNRIRAILLKSTFPDTGAWAFTGVPTGTAERTSYPSLPRQRESAALHRPFFPNAPRFAGLAFGYFRITRILYTPVPSDTAQVPAP